MNQRVASHIFSTFFPAVNFINFITTCFLYKHCFGSFLSSYMCITCMWKKLPKQCLYKKHVVIKLMKLTAGKKVEKMCDATRWFTHYLCGEGGVVYPSTNAGLHSPMFQSCSCNLGFWSQRYRDSCKYRCIAGLFVRTVHLKSIKLSQKMFTIKL